MKLAQLLIIAIAFFGFAFAASQEYCMAQEASCIQQCCPYLEGEYDPTTHDCIYDESKYSDDYLMQVCGTCMQRVSQCMQGTGESATPTPSGYDSGSASCCAGLALLIGAVGLLYAKGR
ncbi:MAG: hypothetical protein N3H30_02470 [Candidatus Micrarchaeota archaeon]|nr:hypothetical protein [Candidatus Micrarchaeota archaeon]